MKRRTLLKAAAAFPVTLLSGCAVYDDGLYGGYYETGVIYQPVPHPPPPPHPHPVPPPPPPRPHVARLLLRDPCRRLRGRLRRRTLLAPVRDRGSDRHLRPLGLTVSWIRG